jgi:DNA invertase Pin-like site-specific DNA recombinase
VNVIGYARVSTDEQGQSGLGLEAQRQAIVDACAQRGWKLLEIQQDVASGGSRKKRPGLERALAACRGRDASGVVVARLDRLTRSLLDFAGILENAQRRGWTLVVLDQGFDLGTPNGRAMAGMLAVFAQWEREIIGQRTSAALQAKMRSGWRPHRAEPLIPAAVRRRIVRLHRAGLSQRKIAERLNADGVPAIGARWHRTTVLRVLAAE